MKALPLSEKFSILEVDSDVFVVAGSDCKQRTVRSIRRVGKYAVISFHEIHDQGSASLLRGAEIAVDAESISLDDGEFFCRDIIGMTVVSTQGDFIGEVSEIFKTAAHDVYVVKGTEEEYLIPAVGAFIKDIDLGKKRMIVEVIGGLLE